MTTVRMEVLGDPKVGRSTGGGGAVTGNAAVSVAGGSSSSNVRVEASTVCVDDR